MAVAYASLGESFASGPRLYFAVLRSYSVHEKRAIDACVPTTNKTDRWRVRVMRAVITSGATLTVCGTLDARPDLSQRPHPLPLAVDGAGGA